MNMQALEKAKEEGRKAAEAGKKLADCVYANRPSLRAEHRAWLEGYYGGKK